VYVVTKADQCPDQREQIFSAQTDISLSAIQRTSNLIQIPARAENP